MTEKVQVVANGPKRSLSKKKSKAFLGDKQSTSSSDDISSAAKNSKDNSAEKITELEIYNAKMCLQQEEIENERLLNHLRRVQRVRMDQDLVNLAGTYLNRVYADKLTEVERLSLESWLSGRLEDERKSWKKQLASYVKEVEKERKLAQESHDKADFLRSKLEYFLDQYGLTPEETYIAAELDARTANTALINNYLEVLGQTLQIYQVERAGIVQMLSEEDLDESESTMPLTEFLKKRLKLIEDAVRLRDIKIQELEESIESDLKKHNNDICRSQKELKDRERVHNVTVKSLTKKLQDLTSIEGLLNISSTRHSSDSCEKSTQTDGPHRKNSQDGISLRKLFHPPDHVGSTNTSHTTHNKPKLLVDGTTVKVGIAYQIPERTMDSPETSQDYRKEDMNNISSKDVDDSETNIDSPRSPLYKAHSDGYLYKSNLLATAEKIRDEGTRYKDGYLSGTRKEVLATNNTALAHTTELILRRVKHRKNSNDTPSRLSPNKSRCLRCHKLYNLRDNHKMACRFHPKAKRKMEKYDNKGRLILVTYIWECCLEHAEVSGCTTGEHV